MNRKKENIILAQKIYGNICINCHSSNDIEWHHVVPLSLGGKDIDTNIVPLCENCHRLVHGRHPAAGISHSELTKAGLEKARLNGKQIGRAKGAAVITKKSFAAKEIIQKHSKDFGGSLTDSEVITLTGLARNTYYKYKRELKEEGLDGP